jgi:hypothetical protein
VPLDPPLTLLSATLKTAHVPTRTQQLGLLILLAALVLYVFIRVL